VKGSPVSLRPLGDKRTVVRVVLRGLVKDRLLEFVNIYDEKTKMNFGP